MFVCSADRKQPRALGLMKNIHSEAEHRDRNLIMNVKIGCRYVIFSRSFAFRSERADRQIHQTAHWEDEDEEAGKKQR